MGKLDGKTAIVTGGAQGMGRSTAERFVEEGANVVIADIQDETGKNLAASLGDSAVYKNLDVTDESGWKLLTEYCLDRYGQIDILINNAAITYFTRGYEYIERIEKQAFQKIFDVNVTGPFLGIKSVTPSMKEKKSGSIVNVSSTDGLRGSCGMSAYNASKWGLRGLTKCMAMELGPFGIRVNSIHPGATDTPMLNPEGLPAEKLDQMFPGIALSRVAQPSEIASVNLFLCSDDASYVSGAEVAIDGGWTCGVYLMDKPKP